MLKKTFLVLFLILSFSATSFAQESPEDDDNSFDPFADYSEFIEASTEESDLNFFKFGRLLSAGAWGGLRTFTGNKGKTHNDSGFFGLFFTYYFSLQFAAQLNWTTGTHAVQLEYPDAAEDFRFTNASLNYQNISFHAKYFINTQNFTKNIAQYNPYIVAGFSLITRKGVTTNTTFPGADSASGFDLGAGVEYLFNNKKAFVGFQLVYQSASFPSDSITPMGGIANNDPATVNNSNGDPLMAMMSIGLNF